MSYNFRNMTADDLRAYAAQCRQDSAESFARCDTDGFLSQAASDVTAQVYDLQAEIVENGGTAIFPALFDLEGNQVAAIRIDGQYGMSWRLLDANGRTAGWFNESKARKPGAARSNDAKKGFYVGRAHAPAVADTHGNRTSFWAVVRPAFEDRFTPGKIVDNGIGDTDLHVHYDICES